MPSTGFAVIGGATTGGGGAPTTATYVTQNDETANLPNSVRVLTIHGFGTLAARPAASVANIGQLYGASDNGIVYRSNGVSWDTYANFIATPVAIANGGTGQTTAPAAWQEYASTGAAVAFKGRARQVIAVANQGSVGTIPAGGASLIGGAQPWIATNELLVGDTYRIVASGELANNSGGSSTMSVNLTAQFDAAAQIVVATLSIAIATAASIRQFLLQADITFVQNAIGSNVFYGSVLSNVSAAAANQLVVANSTAGELTGVGAPASAQTVSGTLDLRVVSSVSNAATTGKCAQFSVAKLSA